VRDVTTVEILAITLESVETQTLTLTRVVVVMTTMFDVTIAVVLVTLQETATMEAAVLIIDETKEKIRAIIVAIRGIWQEIVLKVVIPIDRVAIVDRVRISAITVAIRGILLETATENLMMAMEMIRNVLIVAILDTWREIALLLDLMTMVAVIVIFDAIIAARRGIFQGIVVAVVLITEETIVQDIDETTGIMRAIIAAIRDTWQEIVLRVEVIPIDRVAIVDRARISAITVAIQGILLETAQPENLMMAIRMIRDVLIVVVLDTLREIVLLLVPMTMVMIFDAIIAARRDTFQEIVLAVVLIIEETMGIKVATIVAIQGIWREIVLKADLEAIPIDRVITNAITVAIQGILQDIVMRRHESSFPLFKKNCRLEIKNFSLF